MSPISDYNVNNVNVNSVPSRKGFDNVNLLVTVVARVKLQNVGQCVVWMSLLSLWLVEVMIQVGEIAVDGSFGVVQSGEVAPDCAHVPVDAIGVIEGATCRSQISFPEGFIRLGEDEGPGKGGHHGEDEIQAKRRS